MAPPIIDLTGNKYRFCRVLKRTINNTGIKNRQQYWLCECACGNKFKSAGSALRKHDVSCGCKKGFLVSEGRTTERTLLLKKYRSEYIIWRNMISRCYKNYNDDYENYGGRGIRVCKRWKNSFENFLDDMGPRPSKKRTLDRIDNEKHYTKNNCRWATARQQSNNRRSNLNITYKDETLTQVQWCRKLGLTRRQVKAKFGLPKGIWDTDRGKGRLY